MSERYDVQRKGISVAISWGEKIMTKKTLSEDSQPRVTEPGSEIVCQLWERTLKYKNSDPVASLIYARLTLETILVKIFTKEYGTEPSEEIKLDRLISEIKKKKRALPREFEVLARNVQNYGNFAAHATSIGTLLQISQKYIENCLGELGLVVEWYNPSITSSKEVRSALKEAEPPARTSPFVLDWNQDKTTVTINICIGHPKADEVRQWLVQHHGIANFWTINRSIYINSVEPALRQICRQDILES